MDPIDCTKFYYCIGENEIPTYQGHCTTGTFDLFTQECSTTAPCVTYCTNVVSPDGCIDVFTCEEVGYFPACIDKCGSKFYLCRPENIGLVVEAESCSGDLVFDPNLSSCVEASSCSVE